ncbi:MAG: hypothetical protein V1716_01855 [Candidatus Uhrbacteria bacterium]
MLLVTLLALLVGVANAQTTPPEIIKTPVALPNQVEVVRGIQLARVETYLPSATSTPDPVLPINTKGIIVIPVPQATTPLHVTTTRTWTVRNGDSNPVICVARLEGTEWVLNNTADKAVCLSDPEPVEIPAEVPTEVPAE